MKIAVAELRPNPFRNIKRYPVDPDKVEALKNSIKQTTFWDNLLARRAPDGKGYELAYGVHRLTALKALKTEEIDIPVRKLSNTLMAQIMAHENMAEWVHNASVDQETIRSIIEAYGKGEIELPQPKGGKGASGGVRYAPEFSTRAENSTFNNGHPYTVATLAAFLGYKIYKVETALSALELIEIGVADSSSFKGLSARQAQAVTEQAKRVLNERREADPKQAAATVVRALAGGMNKADGKPVPKENKGRAEVTIHTAKRMANESLGRHLRDAVIGKRPKNLPDIDQFAAEVARKYSAKRFDLDDKIEEIIRHQEHLSDDARKTLVRALSGAINDAIKLLGKLDPGELKDTLYALRVGSPSLDIPRDVSIHAVA
jgi:hypothetical protein